MATKTKALVGPVAIGETITVGDREELVHPSCGANRGRWYCVTHDEHFMNQLQKDFHIGRGKHVMAWLCICDDHVRMERP